LYAEQFLTGLDLNGTFLNAGNCIGHIIGFVDDTVQFENNYTAELFYTPIEDIRWAYPVLNFTGMVSNDFAEIPYTCWLYWVEFYTYWMKIYSDNKSDVSIFIQAFLFTQMGNAKKFKSSIDTIADNNEVQNYIANFHEYGVIANLIFF